MAATSTIWLRVAALLYTLGLLHAVLTVVRRRERLFRIALGGFVLGAVFHLVSIVEQGLAEGRCPVNNFFETMSLCAWILGAAFLAVYYRYRSETLSVFIFPLVFVMTMVASLSKPWTAIDGPALRSIWLISHIIFALLGYAALVVCAVAAIAYLFQERELKRKRPHGFYYRLPALGTLDDLVARSLGAGFVFITGGIIAGSIWGFLKHGTEWVSNPSIDMAFITWAFYLALVFFRVAAGWRGRKTAILSIAALVCSAVTWYAHSHLQGLLQ
jgi:ABC-type transport system involved in cytochrome c biogenesis permease subunit